MRVILQGSLEHFPVAEVLPLLVAHKHGGTLDLVNDASGKRTRVFLRGGRIDWTEASDGQASEEAILDLFTWEGGSFVLADEVALPEGVGRLDLDPTVLIEEGIRRARSMQFRPDQIFKVADNPAAQEAISLSPEEFKILFKLGQGRTVAGLLNETGRTPAELYPIIRTLLKNGLIQEIDQTVIAEETFRVTPVLAEAMRAPVTEEKADAAEDSGRIADRRRRTGKDASAARRTASPSSACCVRMTTRAICRSSPSPRRRAWSGKSA